MHAVFVTFSSSASIGELRTPLRVYARGVAALTGYVSMTWIADGPTLGGFHLFDHASLADDYLAGEVFAVLRHSPMFGAFEVRRFDVPEDLPTINPPGASSVEVYPRGDGSAGFRACPTR